VRQKLDQPLNPHDRGVEQVGDLAVLDGGRQHVGVLPGRERHRSQIRLPDFTTLAQVDGDLADRALDDRAGAARDECRDVVHQRRERRGQHCRRRRRQHDRRDDLHGWRRRG